VNDNELYQMNPITLPGPIMQMNKTVGADLSRTPPMYRPSLAFRYPDEKVK